MSAYDFVEPASFGNMPGSLMPGRDLTSPMSSAATPGDAGGGDYWWQTFMSKTGDFMPENAKELFGDAGVLGSFANLFSMWQKNQHANEYFNFMDELRDDRLAQYADQKEIYNDTFRQRAQQHADYMRRPVDQGYINRNTIA